MIDWGDPERLWIVTNWFLWGAVVVSGLVIGIEIVRAVRLQFRPDERPVPDDHAFLVPELGMTMADGGERREQTVEPGQPTPKAEK